MANPKIEVEVGAKVKDLDKGFDQVDKRLNQTQKEFGKLNDFAVGALQGIAAAFTVGAIIDFGKAVLDTTAKFQKFEAVLTNTLGSDSAAQIALIQIQEFASKTPFAVDELTASFVKLANQGFTPTVGQLRLLGDLASSTGKSFDQLAEAILDAQVGEFERLKEFGIRAAKEGDNVRFTFKGVETQVKATDSAIRDYILSLGDAEGVSGAMAGISETLGGKISNLGDNIETLKLAIGDQTSGVFAASLDWLNSFVEATTRAAKGVSKIREAAQFAQLAKDLDANRKAVQDLATDYQGLDPSLTTVQALAKAISTLKQPLLDAREGGDAFFNQGLTLSQLNERIKGFEDLAIELFKVSKSANLTFEEFSKIADISNKAVFKKFDLEAAAFNFTLRETQKELDEIARIASGIESISLNIFDSEKTDINPVSGIVEFGNLAGNKAPSEDKADVLIEENNKIISSNDLLIASFSSVGSQIGNSLNIADNALKGFVTTVLSNTPQIIAAIFKQAAARKAAAAIENQANLQVATGAAIVTGAKAAAGLGPLGLALLPVFVGGAVALISKAFGKSGGGSSGGGGGGGSVGAGVGSQAYTGSGLERSMNFEFVPLKIQGSDIYYSLEQQSKKRNQG